MIGAGTEGDQRNGYRVAGSAVATNVSSTPCTLRGIPRISIVDATGTSVQLGSGSTPGVVTSPLVVLAPKGSARGSYVWWSYCGPPLALPVIIASGRPPGQPPSNILTVLPTPMPYPSPRPPPPTPPTLLPYPTAMPAPPTRAPYPGPIEESAALTVSTTVNVVPTCVTAAASMEIFPWAAVIVPGNRDDRYYPQTGFRIDDDTIADYFARRGGSSTFGYPISRTFEFQGFVVQIFQRRIVQLDPAGHPQLLNILDPGLLPYTSFNSARFPAYDPAVAAAGWSMNAVYQNAVDNYNGRPVSFRSTFLHTVRATDAFPTGGNAALLPGFDLEMWGVPTSLPTLDPSNHNVVYQRWQRGIMQYDAATGLTQGILLGDYLKSILIGQSLPSDLSDESASSPFYRQYDASLTGGVRDPVLLPLTDLTDVFTPE
jgi:hypothetical protein